MKKNYFILILSILSIQCASDKTAVKIEAKKVQQEKTEIFKLESRLQENLTETEKANIYVQLAGLYMKENHYGKAVELLKSAEKTRKGLKVPHLNHWLGRAFYESADYKSAISYFRKAEAQDSEFETNQRKIMLVKSYFEEKDYGRALGLLGKLAHSKTYKKDQFYYITASRGLFKIREFVKSREVVLEGLRSFPDSKELHNILQEIDSTYQVN